MKRNALFVIGCLAVAPLFAQTTTTTKTKTTTTTSTRSRSTHASASASSSMKSRVLNDASRLGSLLRDAQTTVNVNSDVWKTVSNEANSLANRLYGETSGNATARTAARNLRDEVRQFRTAAQSGDASTARDHANSAMQYVTQLIDWAS